MLHYPDLAPEGKLAKTILMGRPEQIKIHRKTGAAATVARETGGRASSRAGAKLSVEPSRNASALKTQKPPANAGGFQIQRV